MGLLIVKTDFIGKYKIGGTNFDSVDSYIARYEEPLLCELLGVELFKLFKADWEAKTPTTLLTIYQKIYDVIREDNTGGCPAIMQNNGMKQMILGLVWFEYIRELKIKVTSGGATVDEVEVSKQADDSFMYQRYNEAIHDYKVIQWYISEHSEDYTTYNGVKKEIAHWAL